MNSLADKEFDEKLDDLLKASVSPNAAPADLVISIMPQRPRFNWMRCGVVALAIIVVEALLIRLVLALPADEVIEGGSSEYDISHLLSEGIMSLAQGITSPVFLMYAAAVMGSAYILIARRLIRLYRFH